MPIAVLDADALFPMILRDTLLRLAAAGAFRAQWSANILEEMRRNLVKAHGMATAKAEALQAAMERAFPDAMVDGWEALETAMQNHPKDRHVAAAAIAIGAELIVTSNLRHFRPLPEGLAACSPDNFLCRLLAADAPTVLSVLRLQAAGYRRPPLTVTELIDRLAKPAPRFAELTLRLVASR